MEDTSNAAHLLKTNNNSKKNESQDILFCILTLKLFLNNTQICSLRSCTCLASAYFRSIGTAPFTAFMLDLPGKDVWGLCCVTLLSLEVQPGMAVVIPLSLLENIKKQQQQNSFIKPADAHRAVVPKVFAAQEQRVGALLQGK